MRSMRFNWVSVGALATLFLLATVWLAFERQAPKPIRADEFVRALETNDSSLINRYFRERQNPNARGANDRSLLFTAVLREDRILARRLLDAGGSPDLSDDVGVTPLMVAAMHGDLELVRLGWTCQRHDRSGPGRSYRALLRRECAEARNCRSSAQPDAEFGVSLRRHIRIVGARARNSEH